MAGSTPRARGVVGRRGFAPWAQTFLAELAATSNVTAAARAAEVTTRLVYEARRGNARFARAWQVALCEGYDLLELELLRRMRDGEARAATGEAIAKFDNANALRLLAAHRESAARERAMRENEDEEAVLAAIEAKLDKMRERWLAAQADEERDGEEG